MTSDHLADRDGDGVPDRLQAGRFDSLEPRVVPTSTSQDPTPVDEQLEGDTAGVGQYTPMGQVAQQVSFARGIAREGGRAGRVWIWIAVVVVAAIAVLGAVEVLGDAFRDVDYGSTQQ